MGKFLKFSIILSSILILSGCAGDKVKPPKPKMSFSQEMKINQKQKDFTQYETRTISEEEKRYEGEQKLKIIDKKIKEAKKVKSDKILKEKKITIIAKDEILTNILFQINNQLGSNLVISDEVYKEIEINNKRINLSLKNASVYDTLNILMEMTDNYYEYINNILYIKRIRTFKMNIPFSNLTNEFSGDFNDGFSKSKTSTEGGTSLKYESKLENSDFFKMVKENIENMLSEKGKYTINIYTGVVTVTDNYKNSKKIEEFLKDIKFKSLKQVYIEAKIVEVILNDDNKIGINWDKTFESLSKYNIGIAYNPINMTNGNSFRLSYNGQGSNPLNMIVDLLDQQGDTSIMSSPKVSVLNNQSAILTSGRLTPYFEKTINYNNYSTDNTTNATVPVITYERRDVLQGVSLVVKPVIQNNNQIILNVIPVTSEIEDEKQQIDENGEVVSTAPIINIKRIATTVKINDGDIIVIGGLIDRKKVEVEDKVPVLGDIPVLGNLFKSKENSMKKRELVILLKVKIK